MKILSIVIVTLFSIVWSIDLESPDFSLDGKTYTINNYINGKLDNTEDIKFIDGTMEGSVCVQYGFAASAYKITDADGKTFECTMLSKAEGKMVWKGKVENHKVKGTCLWTKDGQNPILFEFEGVLKK